MSIVSGNSDLRCDVGMPPNPARVLFCASVQVSWIWSKYKSDTYFQMNPNHALELLRKYLSGNYIKRLWIGLGKWATRDSQFIKRYIQAMFLPRFKHRNNIQYILRDDYSSKFFYLYLHLQLHSGPCLFEEEFKLAERPEMEWLQKERLPSSEHFIFATYF